MDTDTTSSLTRELNMLLTCSLSLSSPLQSIHLLRQKIEQRGYRAFDREDLLLEMGSLERRLEDMHGSLLRLDVLLKSCIG